MLNSCMDKNKRMREWMRLDKSVNEFILLHRIEDRPNMTHPSHFSTHLTLKTCIGFSLNLTN